jgi:eukaryotic-like serine/threonine-protein kinase
MMHVLSEEAIFNSARRIASPDERRLYLEQSCDGDDALRVRVEALLRVQDLERTFLQSPAAMLAVSDDGPVGEFLGIAGEMPGTVIGSYKLLEQIGEGGFGVVFAAEQQEPIRRKVAFKVLKPGMDSRQVIARFEVERQALALMDHPHIAKVLDAGQTPTGRPYFAMDLVKGLPITEYCDRARLAPRDRLALFLDVCRAVQHAHQKGIIHRDIKPSNVLVTLQDGAPVVKVIDFGIAKVLGRQLTDKTIVTGFAQMIGTPLYMAPEQAALSSVDVDTRSDIYSLGVLLYELMTGATPFERERFDRAGFDELRRIIRDEEPPRPSTRLSSLGQAATVVSAHRQSDPRRLCQLLKGELDWIVMKALAKERDRRYDTAGTLAGDVERYLSGGVVSACPPSTWYRFRKLAKRHRAWAIAGAAAATALILGVAGLGALVSVQRSANVKLRRADSETKAALAQSEESRQQAEAVSNFLVDAFRSPAKSQSGREVKVADLLEKASAQLDLGFAGSEATRGALLDALGRTYRGLGLYSQAVSLLRKARAVREAALGPDHPDTRRTCGMLAAALSFAGQSDEAIALHEETLKFFETNFGPDHPDTLRSRNNLALAYWEAGRFADAIPLQERTLKQKEAELGPAHTDTMNSRNNLANSYLSVRRRPEAVALHEANLKFREAKLGADHPVTLMTRNNLAAAYADAGKWSEAAAMYESVLELYKTKLGPDDPERLKVYNNLALVYKDLGRLDESIVLFESTLRLREATLGRGHQRTFASRINLGEALVCAGRTVQAIELFESSLELGEAKLGPWSPVLARASQRARFGLRAAWSLWPS